MPSAPYSLFDGYTLALHNESGDLVGSWAAADGGHRSRWNIARMSRRRLPRALTPASRHAPPANELFPGHLHLRSH